MTVQVKMITELLVCEEHKKILSGHIDKIFFARAECGGTSRKRKFICFLCHDSGMLCSEVNRKGTGSFAMLFVHSEVY